MQVTSLQNRMILKLLTFKNTFPLRVFKSFKSVPNFLIDRGNFDLTSCDIKSPSTFRFTSVHKTYSFHKLV